MKKEQVKEILEQFKYDDGTYLLRHRDERVPRLRKMASALKIPERSSLKKTDLYYVLGAIIDMVFDQPKLNVPVVEEKLTLTEYADKVCTVPVGNGYSASPETAKSPVVRELAKVLTPNRREKEMDKKHAETCVYETCVHDSVCGKHAVELYAEARILGNVCDARYQYLMRQAKSFHTWLGEIPEDSTEPRCDDPTGVCTAIVRRIEDELRDDTGDVPDYLLDCHHGLDDMYVRLEDERTTYDEYWSTTESSVDKAMYSMEARLSWYKGKIMSLQDELALHDRIQDAIDNIPAWENVPPKYAEQWRKYRIKCFSRIDQYRKERKLSYNGWFLFNNQLLKKINRPEKEYPYGEMRYLPDVISYYENKMQIKKDEIEQSYLENKPSELPPEDYIHLQAEFWPNS